MKAARAVVRRWVRGRMRVSPVRVGPVRRSAFLLFKYIGRGAELLWQVTLARLSSRSEEFTAAEWKRLRRRFLREVEDQRGNHGQA